MRARPKPSARSAASRRSPDCSARSRAGRPPPVTRPRWPDTALTARLGLRYPVILAPMAGGPSTPELVAAVSNEGGLGMLGAGYLAPDAIRAAIRSIRALTGPPVGRRQPVRS